MKYALIKNEKVENIILADVAFVSQIESQWDDCVDISELNPWPSIGWSYVGGVFSPPSIPVDIKAIINSARIFGRDLMDRLAAENVMLGITQAGKTADVRRAMGEVIECLLTGSLYDAIAQLKAIPEDKKDATFITNARLLSAVNEIEAYLGIPRSTSL